MGMLTSAHLRLAQKPKGAKRQNIAYVTIGSPVLQSVAQVLDGGDDAIFCLAMERCPDDRHRGRDRQFAAKFVGKRLAHDGGAVKNAHTFVLIETSEPVAPVTGL